MAAAQEGRTPDPSYGQRGKQRSVHNTYFTLPVLFVMISNHYAMTYGHEHNWLILIALSLAGALVRVYFVMRHGGRASPLPLAAAALLVAAVALAIAPSASRTGEAPSVEFDAVQAIITERCTGCHSQSPEQPGFASAPGGLALDNREQIRANAGSIYRQTVVSRAMPIGNLTEMTEDERRILAQWYENRDESE